MDGWCKAGTGFREASEQQLTSPDVTMAVPGPGGMDTPWAWGLWQLRKLPPWNHQSHQLQHPNIFSALFFCPWLTPLFSPSTHCPPSGLSVLSVVSPWVFVSPPSLPRSGSVSQCLSLLSCSLSLSHHPLCLLLSRPPKFPFA